jgi:UDP-glucose 4-epimerase
MSARVLLTGGTGLVGPDLVARLTASGYEVVCLSRRPPPAAGVTWVAADLADDPDRVLASVPVVDAVVHAAAARAAPAGDGLAYLRRVNMTFTEALFAWAGSRRAASVVYLSGFNLLRRPLDSVITEDHPLAPVTPYAVAKHWGELALAEHAGRWGFRSVCLRVSSPLPFAYDRLHDTVLKTWIDRARGGQPLVVHGRGERAQDFVATTDVAAAVAAALGHPAARGTYNVASGTTLTMRELAGLVAGRWPVPMRFEGVDALADERWNVAIDRARADFGYDPAHSARAAVERLLAAIPTPPTP